MYSSNQASSISVFKYNRVPEISKQFYNRNILPLAEYFEVIGVRLCIF